MKLPKIKLSKKVIAIGAAAGLAMGAAGIAAAYFSSTGTGSGTSNVGHPTAFVVTQQGASVGTMYPGYGTSVQQFNITNKGKGVQHYTIVPGNASIATTGGDIVTADTTTKVTGCQSTWFTATAAAASGTLTPGDRATDTVTITMTNAAATQNTCQGRHPKVLLHVGS